MNEPHYLKEELYNLVSNNEEIFDFLQKGSLDGLWYWDIENPENEWMNSRFWELLGYDPKEKKHLASEWQDLINPDDLKSALENFKKHCDDPNHPYDQIVRYCHKNGKTVWVRCRGIAIRDKEGKPVRMLGAHNDLTEVKELEEKLRIMAMNDELTGLPNKRSFREHLEWSIKNALRKKQKFSVAMLDLDHFKKINDTYGHQKGDEVLRSVGEVLKSGRQNDFPARFGGEEFIVILHDTDEYQSVIASEKIRNSIAETKVHKEKITVSIGISTFSPEQEMGSNSFFDSLIGTADEALYSAKQSGRNRVVHYIDTPKS